MKTTVALIGGILLSLSSPLKAEPSFSVNSQQLWPLGYRTFEVANPSQLDSEMVALLVNALNRHEPIEVVRTGGNWIIGIGVTPADRVDSTHNVIALLDQLVATNKSNHLLLAAEDYASELSASVAAGEVAGDANAINKLLRATHAALLGVNTFILDCNAEFEHFVVVNHIEKDLNYFGHHVQLNRYNSPMIQLQGEPATLTQIKSRVPMTDDGKMVGWAYVRGGGLVPLASSDADELVTLREQVVRLQEELKHQERAVIELDRALQEKSSKIEVLKADVETRSHQITSLNNTITDLHTQVGNRDEALAKAEVNRKAQAAKITELTQRVDERDVTIANKDKEIERLNKVNGGKDRDVEKLIHTINAKDREIERLHQEVDKAKQSTTGKESEVDKLQKALSAKEHEVAKQSQVLEAKDHEIQDLKAQVKELSRQLRELSK